MIPQEITREHLLSALKEIDSKGVPPDRESTVWLLEHEGKVYPPKYVISIASKYALGHEHGHELFSGGPETNTFLKSRGFEIILKSRTKAYSWEIEDDDTAVKLLDKSAFKHGGTGIPSEMNWFFVEHTLKPGRGPEITLMHGGNAYTAYLEFRDYGAKRTRLFWNTEFSSLLQHAFPYHFEQYKANRKPSTKVFLRFNRLDGFQSYLVTLAGKVDEGIVAEDIDAEEIEEVGPRAEGGVKLYYGKRYERDPVNRRKAIEFHGLTCAACGFNFEETYGERGSGYIEVHHVKPISTFNVVQHVDPRTDLITLCSNCHRMVHRKADAVLTIQELQNMLMR